MMRLIDKEPIYIELYEAIAHFWSREQLVLRAIVDQGVSPAELPKGVSAWHDKTPQQGKWGTEWGFMFHGGGCELKHIQTGEPIDWNGPNPEGFSPLSFIHHLKWRLAQDHNLPYLRQFVEQNNAWAVHDLIDRLIADGMISEDYRLTPRPTDLTTHADAA
jgi:hypothetical protein